MKTWLEYSVELLKNMKKFVDRDNNEYYLIDNLDIWLDFTEHRHKLVDPKPLDENQKKHLTDFWHFIEEENNKTNQVLCAIFTDDGLVTIGKSLAELNGPV